MIMDSRVRDGALMFGVFRLWTFGSCDVLIDAMHRFGFEEWMEIEDFAGAGKLRREKSRQLVGIRAARPFAAILARPVVDVRSGCTIESVLEVSPFDGCFPAIDWRAELPLGQKRRRRSIGSRISALYLRDMHEYPSTLTIQVNAPSPSILNDAFRSFCETVPDVLEGVDDVVGAGLLTSGDFALPPESLAPRIEQIHELRAKVDRDYPVVYVSAQASSASGGLWMAADGLTSDDASILPTQFRVVAMSEREYRNHLVARGVFETPDGALVLGDRRSHELHASATALYESTDRTLCPLTNEVLDRALGLPATKRPLLLVSSERRRELSACVESYSTKLAAVERAVIAEGLVQALLKCSAGIGPETAQALRAACL